MQKMKPTLLVPILIDAMVVDNNLSNQSRKYALNSNDYKRVTKFEQANPNFIEQSNHATKGIHLQWLLPESLTQGKEVGNNSEIEFPKVPNRWLVNRLYLNDNNEIQIKSWLILSDFIEENPTNKANYLLEKNGKLIPCRLGKTIDLKDFQGDKKEKDLFLSAIGSGDAAFSVFTPENKNIFSFIDEMQDLEKASLLLSYQVSGWYSNQDFNPINTTYQNTENLIEELHHLNFSFSNVLDIKKANDFDKLKIAEKAFENWAKKQNNEPNYNGLDLFCHGTLYHILWNKKSKNSANNRLPEIEPEVIIANSSFDGITRLIQEKMMNEQDLSLEDTEKAIKLLAAFEYDLVNEIDKNGGIKELNKKAHQSWFTAENGGNIWEIKANTEVENLENQLINLGAYQLLNQLNTVQVELNKAQNNKASIQTKLYSTYIKQEQNRNKESLNTDFQEQLKNFESAIENIKSIEISREKLLNELNILLDNNFENITLNKVSQPNYWEANEPVLLIHSTKGIDKYAYNKVLKCRFSGQTISNLKEHYTAQTIDFQTPTLPNSDKLPLVIPDLLKEAILINPDFSSFLLKQITTKEQTTAETIQKQQTLIWNDEIYQELDNKKLLEIAGFSGERLALKAFSKHFPNQNFSPLFLDWSVNYFPNGKDKLTNWNLNDFEFLLKAEEFDEFNKYTFSGRTLLSTQTSVLLLRKLKSHQKNINEETDKSLLNNIIGIIDGLDIVSQQISGFNEMLLGIDINDIIPIENENIKNKVDGGTLGFPLQMENIHAFRNGFIIPNIVQITDDFGQVISPIDERENRIPKILKANGIDDKQIEQTNISLLTPRLIQKSRILVDFIGIDTNQPLYLANEDTPILAWLMTDYLDKSLTIYDNSGYNIGELITFQRSEKGEARWLPNDAKPFPNTTIENLVKGIIDYENNGSALSAMMRTIDDGIMLNQMNSVSDTNVFSLLFGQPLALVKCRFSLEVKGLLANEELKDLEFPLIIGQQDFKDNGVIGYFKNDDFSNFYSLNDKDLSNYINSTALENVSIKKDLELILLINPNGKIHTISGILPTFELQLPAKYQDAIANMEMKFRVKPIITNPNEIQLPKLGSNSNKMVWQQANYQATSDIKPINTEVDFGKGRNIIREGWLKVK